MKRAYLSCSLLVGLTFQLIAQEFSDDHQMGDKLVTNVDLFEENEPLEMTLTFDMKMFQREKNSLTGYIEAYYGMSEKPGFIDQYLKPTCR